MKHTLKRIHVIKNMLNSLEKTIEGTFIKVKNKKYYVQNNTLYLTPEYNKIAGHIKDGMIRIKGESIKNSTFRKIKSFKPIKTRPLSNKIKMNKTNMNKTNKNTSEPVSNEEPPESAMSEESVMNEETPEPVINEDTVMNEETPEPVMNESTVETPEPEMTNSEYESESTFPSNTIMESNTSDDENDGSVKPTNSPPMEDREKYLS